MADETLTAIGLMSGTSMDGIDAAVLRTDGERVAGFGPSLSIPYDAVFRDRLRACLGRDPEGDGEAVAVAEILTGYHVDAVRRLISENDVDPATVDVIGFHGHTVWHRPEKGITRQIGNGARLARDTGIAVVSDFRANDVAHGGQGAPFAPLYHAALSWNYEKPLAVLNIGGVANVTWISADGGLCAFDTGPGNALIDDWVRSHGEGEMDLGGQLAHGGQVDEGVLADLLDNPYFSRPYPKSLDREDFDLGPVSELSLVDGAATLTAFTAAAVECAVHFLPALPNRWLVCGGGRHNPAIMAALRRLLIEPVEPAEMAGWQGDALEAQAFGFLAVRSLKGLPLSLPSTTGVRQPSTGGVLHQPERV
ncbi:MAG: anhydro-N-acetylmuramic acid kinase [Alphaproteobacteria bacterium]|nr:anhydro-N-acetylmuramic acid kinase [Alphaproteobacteria bacterium]